MAEFKTPKKYKTPEKMPPPIRIPPSPFLQELGYGCGMFIFFEYFTYFYRNNIKFFEKIYICGDFYIFMLLLGFEY